jgi:hypothetical protein
MADDPEGASMASSAEIPGRRPPGFMQDNEFDNMRQFYRTTLVQVELQ